MDFMTTKRLGIYRVVRGSNRQRLSPDGNLSRGGIAKGYGIVKVG